jgi:hypothetical protein
MNLRYASELSICMAEENNHRDIPIWMKQPALSREGRFGRLIVRDVLAASIALKIAPRSRRNGK